MCWIWGALFPNFDADEDDPANYDFELTDKALEWMFAAGTEPFFRLGAWVSRHGDECRRGGDSAEYSIMNCILLTCCR